MLNSGTGATGLRMLGRLLWPLVLSPFTRHSLRRYISNPKRADLEWLADRAAEGSLRPVIGSTFALGETAAALQLIEGGHSRGKVVIEVIPGEKPASTAIRVPEDAVRTTPELREAVGAAASRT